MREENSSSMDAAEVAMACDLGGEPNWGDGPKMRALGCRRGEGSGIRSGVMQMGGIHDAGTLKAGAREKWSVARKTDSIAIGCVFYPYDTAWDTHGHGCSIVFPYLVPSAFTLMSHLHQSATTISFFILGYNRRAAGCGGGSKHGRGSTPLRRVIEDSRRESLT